MKLRRRSKEGGASPPPMPRRGALRGTLQVVSGEAWASVRAGWDGSIRVALVVVNFGRRDLTLKDLHLRHVRIGPTHVADPRPLAEERDVRLGAHSATRVFLDLRLGADDVARLRRGFEPAPNRSSSPRVDMECAGDLVVRRRIRQHSEPFLLDHMAVSWTVAEDGLPDDG